MKSSVWASVVLVGLTCLSAFGEPPVNEILGKSGLHGGLIVRIGCGDGTQVTNLHFSDAFVVEGLDTDPAVVQKAREHVLAKDLSGSVSVAAFDGTHLPFVNSLVNLVITEDLGDIAMSEVMRVLCPGGSVFVGQGNGWKVATKPWPNDIDEWTHYLHDPNGTSVSNDLVAGHPNGLRWTGGPFWARSHEHTASMQAMVSAAGKVFYVFDEGPTDSIQLPSKMVLTARDAFNGTVLWKFPLHDWFNALFPLKSGPGWMPRRLVAVGDKVYIAPGLGQDVVCLDANTGKVVREYKDTATTFELLVSNGVVFAAVDPSEQFCDYRQENANCWKERDRASSRWGWHRETDGMRVVKALEADTGKLLWKMQSPVAPMTLSADSKMVCFYDGRAVVAVDRNTGTQLWKTDTVLLNEIGTGYAGPRLILCKQRVVFSPLGYVFALSPETGKIIWSLNKKPRSGHYSLEEFYVIGDRVWIQGRGNAGSYLVYSLKDGTKLEETRNPIRSFYIHQRCYPGRATKRFQLPAMMGLTIYDMAKNEWSINDWIRGGCTYGLMPANGMIYTPPNACACYYQSKLNGFDAVAPDAQSATAPPAEQRLVKGPAYGMPARHAEYAAADWPVFRHDNTRSGYVRTDVPADVHVAWENDFGTKLSQPVIADGKLFLSAVDLHTVYALDAASGHELWHFVAGARVDSPPSLYQGLAIFGCADGCVYALNANDGQLAWRFQVAPSDRKLMAFGQIESVWPLSGSVLVQDGKLYCVAGRSMFLDGGLRMAILDPMTGALLAENVMDDRVPNTNEHLQDLLMGKHMPVAMPDILSSDGEYVYMKSQSFTKDGKRVRVRPQRPDTQYDQEVHLFSPISFLDDAWHQRTYWIYGRAAGEGWAEFQYPPKRVPCGRALCIDENNVYGYGRRPELLCNTSVSEYQLYSTNKRPARKVGVPRLEGQNWTKGQYPTDNPLAANSVDWKQLAQLPTTKLTALKYHWLHNNPDVMAKAMVLANDRLFVAGPRDVVDEERMWGRSNEKEYKDLMTLQAEWLAGSHGGMMEVFSKEDGAKLGELKLPHLPAFDGLTAASGCLYMVTKDGVIVCYRGK